MERIRLKNSRIEPLNRCKRTSNAQRRTPNFERGSFKNHEFVTNHFGWAPVHQQSMACQGEVLTIDSPPAIPAYDVRPEDLLGHCSQMRPSEVPSWDSLN